MELSFTLQFVYGIPNQSDCHKNFAGRFYNIMMVPCKMNPDHDQAFKAIDFSLLRILSVHKECIVRTSVLFMYSSALLSSENMISKHSNIFCKYIIPNIKKEYAFLLLTTTLLENGIEMGVPPVIQLFPLHVVVFVEYK